MNNKKIAVVLSGCGVYDGAEVNEVVLTLLALEQNELTYQCFAPDIAQHHVINHLTGVEMPEKRNVLVESARITRGQIKALSKCTTNEFSAIIVPGGFGVSENLSNFASRGDELEIQKDFFAVCQNFKNSHKPSGFICIAPVLLSKIYGIGVVLTIGNDENTISAITSMGGKHKKTTVNEIVVDEKNKIVTTAAYMLAASIVEAKSGIDKLVKKIKEMI